MAFTGFLPFKYAWSPASFLVTKRTCWHLQVHMSSPRSVEGDLKTVSLLREGCEDAGRGSSTQQGPLPAQHRKFFRQQTGN